MSRELILAFWKAMATNDFHHASRWLDPGFEYYMPQTREYLRGPEAFAALNTAYPQLEDMRLIDYKVRILTPGAGVAQLADPLAVWLQLLPRFAAAMGYSPPA